MNFQSVVRLFHFHHCKNTGQNISDMLVLLLREFEIAFSSWQQYSEIWMLLKSAASRAAGGRLCTTCKALVISRVFDDCQINKKQTKPTKPTTKQKQSTKQTTPLPPRLNLHLLRTVNVAYWNLISLLYRRWTLLFEISSVSLQKAVTSVKHLSLKWMPDFLPLYTTRAPGCQSTEVQNETR